MIKDQMAAILSSWAKNMEQRECACCLGPVTRTDDNRKERARDLLCSGFGNANLKALTKIRLKT